MSGWKPPFGGGKHGRTLAVAAIVAGTFALTPEPAASHHHHHSRCPNKDAHAHKVSLRKLRHAVYCLVRKRREGHVRQNRRLQHDAQQHTDRMLNQNCFSHQCYSEPDPTSRVRNSGYTKGAYSWSYGENIGYARTPRGVVRAWMHSSEHRANLLRSGFEDFGVGVGWGCPVKGKKNRGYETFTIDLAQRSPG